MMNRLNPPRSHAGPSRRCFATAGSNRQSGFRQRGLFVVLLAVLLFVQPVTFAAAPSDDKDKTASEALDMGDHITCGVLFGIMTGSLISSDRHSDADLAALSTYYKERTVASVAAGKAAAVREYGEDLGPEIYADEWRAVYSDMMEEMGRNYARLSRLRYKYGDRCNLRPKFD